MPLHNNQMKPNKQRKFGLTSLIGNVGSTSTSDGAKSMLSVISVRMATRRRAL